jgi:SAM-dependent methyltransferase
MRRRLAKHRLVEKSYDHIAEAYLASKEACDAEADDAGTDAPFQQLMEMLPAGAPVLDLGCGSGVPFTRRLAERFAVTGVDTSARQLELARAHVPAAHLIKADMTTVEFPAGSFDAVVACFSIIHVPREEHGGLVARIYRWLRPGGLFLAPWTIWAWEELADWCGAPMWWSHFDADTNLDLIRTAGFEIVSDDTRTSEDTPTGPRETWLWVLARKPNGGPGQVHPPRRGPAGRP